MRPTLLFLALLIAIVPGGGPCLADDSGAATSPDETAALDLECLRQAYPGIVTDMVRDPDGRLFVVLSAGGRILYDDGRRRTNEKELLAAPSLREAMEQLYPLGSPAAGSPPPAPGFHPGRRRNMDFFKAVYGADPGTVSRELAPVPFPGGPVRLNARNGAAAALCRVGARLTALLRERPELAGRVLPASAGLAWRPIAGTDRLSLHGLALAVDLAPGRNIYWRWNRGRTDVGRQTAAFPAEILAAFEDNGFIWGGKWAEYDLMHFEYRPELLCKSRRLAGQRDAAGPPAALAPSTAVPGSPPP